MSLGLTEFRSPTYVNGAVFQLQIASHQFRGDRGQPGEVLDGPRQLTVQVRRELLHHTAAHDRQVTAGKDKKPYSLPMHSYNACANSVVNRGGFKVVFKWHIKNVTSQIFFVFPHTSISQIYISHQIGHTNVSCLLHCDRWLTKVIDSWYPFGANSSNVGKTIVPDITA